MQQHDIDVSRAAAADTRRVADLMELLERSFGIKPIVQALCGSM